MNDKKIAKKLARFTERLAKHAGEIEVIVRVAGRREEFAAWGAKDCCADVHRRPRTD